MRRINALCNYSSVTKCLVNEGAIFFFLHIKATEGDSELLFQKDYVNDNLHRRFRVQSDMVLENLVLCFCQKCEKKFL